MSLGQLEALSHRAFLQLLREKDIELRLQEGRLRINAPAGSVTDSLKSEMLRRKDFLIDVCRSARTIQGSLVLRESDVNSCEAPLTHAQERLWLLERFHPGNAAYNIPEVFEISTPLDPSILQRAVNIIVSRHDTLRTQIIESDDGMVQRVCANTTLTVSNIDLTARHAADRDAHVRALLRQESRRPFDLAVAPLARIYLYHLGVNRNLLLINLHHIIADRWSTGILYRELLIAYTACERGSIPDLPLLPIQYADFAVWERGLSASRMKQQISYWRQQLSSLPEPLTLPFSKPDASASSSEGAVYALELNEEDTSKLRSFAKKHGASLYMVFLAAYCSLLNRYTGMTDICIGSPVSERNFRETEPLIGLFVNTVVMRCRIAERSGFAELLHSVRNTVLDAHANRDLPFQKLLTLASNHASPSSQAVSPLFQTMLAFDSLPVATSSTGRTMIELDPGFAKFDLTLQLREDPDCIRGWFEYRKDIASEESIGHFAVVFLRLLNLMIRSPEEPLAELEILLPAEKHLLLHSWNDTAMPFPCEHTIHRMFAEQAEQTPQEVAVIDGTRRVTYSQLDNASDNVARLLLAAGVQTETIVGVQLPRTVEMVAALLGILKAGAAYLPLDAHQPAARTQSMLEDSGCRLVLADTAETHRWSGLAKVLQLPDLFARPQEQRVPTAGAPTNLAYVIYTSGSTGRPKGVAIEHHSVVSFLTWGRKTFPIELLRGTLASTSISFDLSVFEIFLPLTTGGTVILARDILQLPELPASKEVTLATTVPSAAAAMLDSGSIPSTLRNLNLAGELLSDDLLDRLYSGTNLETIHDLYGPTETTTYSTCALRRKAQPANIGRPIANTRVYILDDSLRLVPIGMIGELFIAGEGVARGYLNQPELTNQRFLSLVHLGEHGRAYRTGDLCRYNLDGTLVYHGRRDHQVKLNGFRVELGEIEAVLRSHPSVDDAVVMAQVVAGGTILTAAVRGRAFDLNVNELILHQSMLLPPHMVVRRLVEVETFPHTPNGKVDRKQLAVDVASAQPASQEMIHPTDKLETQVLKIWRDSFLDDTIGVDDDFFQVGGHSLLALRIFSDIEARLGHRVMLSILFQSPTVRGLARHLRSLEAQRQSA